MASQDFLKSQIRLLVYGSLEVEVAVAISSQDVSQQLLTDSLSTELHVLGQEVAGLLVTEQHGD